MTLQIFSRLCSCPYLITGQGGCEPIIPPDGHSRADDPLLFLVAGDAFGVAVGMFLQLGVHTWAWLKYFFQEPD